MEKSFFKTANDWMNILKSEVSKPYFIELARRIEDKYANNTVFPERSDLFKAFELCAYKDVKAVILGQDPYHGKGQANGLAFSVCEGVRFPKSLQNIFKELVSDIGISYPQSGDLSAWAKQGMLLLNTSLSVKESSPGSHCGLGWERFTDEVISLLNLHPEPVAFVLWGNHAAAKEKLITAKKHLILKNPHPSPLSAHRGFFGSKPFSKVNDFLTKQSRKIDWSL